MSLSRENKINSKETFDHVFKSPDVKISNELFLLLGKKTNKLYPRLGVALKKKNIKLAVHRNILKRKIKNSFMANKNNLKNLDYVVMSNKCIKVNDKNINKNLNSLWQNVFKN